MTDPLPQHGTSVPPRVIVIGGPNGAGKTTSSRSLLAETLHNLNFVNPDIIAQGLAGFDPESAAWEASRIMLDRLTRLSDERRDFAFETTLAARAYANRIRRWQEVGYVFQLYYFWVPSPEFAIRRVALRVRQGGHFVPDDTVRHRYFNSIANLTNLYLPLADLWKVYDSSEPLIPRLIVTGGSATPMEVFDDRTWQLIRQEQQS